MSVTGISTESSLLFTHQKPVVDVPASTCSTCPVVDQHKTYFLFVCVWERFLCCYVLNFLILFMLSSLFAVIKHNCLYPRLRWTMDSCAGSFHLFMCVEAGLGKPEKWGAYFEPAFSYFCDSLFQRQNKKKKEMIKWRVFIIKIFRIH